MKKDEIQQQIESFYGNLSAAYMLIATLQQHLNVDFSNIMMTSDPEQKFLNFARNLINKKVIERPMKSGRSLILNGRNILELLVARKYISMGVSMNALVNQISDKPTGELFEKLFADQLPDIIQITSEFSSTLIPDEDAEDEIEDSPDTDLFHHLEINSDMCLMVRQGAYDKDVVERVVKYLKRQKRS